LTRTSRFFYQASNFLFSLASWARLSDNYIKNSKLRLAAGQPKFERYLSEGQVGRNSSFFLSPELMLRSNHFQTSNECLSGRS